MRYELADYEWTAIKPMLPNKPRGVPRVNSLTSKIHALVDSNGMPVRLALSPGRGSRRSTCRKTTVSFEVRVDGAR